MSLIKNKNTHVELSIRRLVHGLGYRYRLHGVGLPGCPDLVFPGRRKVIFIHGCFWHRHGNCRLARLPKSRLDFWLPKLEGNRKRDAIKHRLLNREGWRYLVIWECQIRKSELLTKKLKNFLGTAKQDA